MYIMYNFFGSKAKEDNYFEILFLEGTGKCLRLTWFQIEEKCQNFYEQDIEYPDSLFFYIHLFDMCNFKITQSPRLHSPTKTKQIQISVLGTPEMYG